MTLTAKNFNKIAEILNINVNKEYVDIKQSCIFKIIDDLAKYFKTDNPNFQAEKFKEACLK